jgi:hypothetical protein
MGRLRRCAPDFSLGLLLLACFGCSGFESGTTVTIGKNPQP